MSENYYVMLHDELRCIGCQACTVACANLNDITKPFARVQVQITLPQDGKKARYVFERQSCRHCENAPCVAVCPTGATFKDENGIVQVNPDNCINCSYCLGACPYHVRYMDKTKKTADKCDFCTHSRLSRDEAPACVSVCPTGALAFGRVDSEAVKEWLAKHPNVYQESAEGAGKAHVYRSREVHND